MGMVLVAGWAPVRDVRAGTMATGSVAAAQPDGSLEQEVLLRINRIRADHGLQPVEIDPRLQQAARLHSSDMAVSRCFQHDDCNGGGAWSERIYASYPRPARIAENITAGHAEAAAAVEAWMRSEAHRANILRPEWRGTGIAHVSLPGSPYGHYWTQTFGVVAPPSAADALPAPALSLRRLPAESSSR